MNIIELTFEASASANIEVRLPIHKDKALRDYILGSLQAPAGSLKIQRSTIPNAGSGLFTSLDHKAGDLLFTSEPLVLCAEVGEGSEACDFCFQQRRRVFHPVEDRFVHPGEVMPPLYICNGCKMYQYCSKACSERAWDTGHLYECGLLAGASKDLETRILYRLLILMRKGVLLPTQVGALARLDHQMDNFEQRTKKAWSKILNMAHEAKVRTKSELNMREVLMLYGIIRCNSLPVDQTYRNAPLGNALDLGGAMMNHCCDPNVVVVFNSTQVEVRALRPLKAGEELLHCYRDIAYDFTFRNPRIEARYQFRCQCDRCKGESDVHHQNAPNQSDVIPVILNTQASLFEIIDESRQHAFSTPNTYNVQRQLAKVDKILSTGYAGREWPHSLEPLPTVLKALSALCERQGDLSNTLRLRIKASAQTTWRKGLTWSEDLIDFVLCLSTAATAIIHPSHRHPNMPKQRDFLDAYIGHLHALHAMLVTFYGPEGRTTRIVHRQLLKETAGYNGPGLTTRAFRRKFKVAQENLLKWAGCDASLWPVE